MVWDSLNSISAALMFAKEQLSIRSDTFIWDWVLETHDPKRGYAGLYDPAARQMRFNGEPTLGTILHEAVHYHQHERGDDLIAGYAAFASQVASQMVGSKDEIARKAYWNCPWEIEAREKAWEMAIAYRDRRAGVAHWA